MPSRCVLHNHRASIWPTMDMNEALSWSNNSPVSDLCKDHWMSQHHSQTHKSHDMKSRVEVSGDLNTT